MNTRLLQSIAVPAGLILAAALSRLIPHPPNFSPIEASALFAGAYLLDRRAAVLVPILAMLLSDLVLGFHALVPVTYGCMALMALAGRWLAGQATVGRVAAISFASATFFFIVSNFFVWLTQGMYPMSFDGLALCYVEALPFFQNEVAGVALYSSVLFGGYALLRKLTAPKPQAASA
jgi:hypothetical protein